MSGRRLMRIGVLAEGPTELGQSIREVFPEDGGKPIKRENEGALHTFIRRALELDNEVDCEFIQIHPLLQSSGVWKPPHTGHNILDSDYIQKCIVAWSPADDVDLIVICVDSDDQEDKRGVRLQQAVELARQYHFNGQSKQIAETSIGGLAIKSIETWLIADNDAVYSLLNVSLPSDLPEDLEVLPGAKRDLLNSKKMLDEAIRQSDYRRDIKKGRRKLVVRWQLAKLVDMERVKRCCQRGYGCFAADLSKAVHIIEKGDEV